MFSSVRSNIFRGIFSLMSPRRNLKIDMLLTPNPGSIKFALDQKLLAQGTTKYFQNADEDDIHPLARDLLYLSGVKSVMIGHDFVTVSIDDALVETWQILQPEIVSCLKEYFSGPPKFEIVKDVESDPNDMIVAERPTEIRDEVSLKIVELLNDKIRPFVQEDGGDVEFYGFDSETGIVKLKLTGACVGCPSSSVTLHHGIENMLQYYLPEVKGVLQVHDKIDVMNIKTLKAVEEKLK